MIKVSVIRPMFFVVLGMQITYFTCLAIYYWYDTTNLGFITTQTENMWWLARYILLFDFFYVLGASFGFSYKKEVYRYERFDTDDH